MTYWQVAKGDGSRDASEYFLRYDLAAIGPGDWGDYRLKPDKYTNDQFIPRLATEVQVGDRVVIRSGIKSIRAVGVVCKSESVPIMSVSAINDSYGYVDAFGDLDGMDWQHTIRVKWKQIDWEFKRNVFGMRSNRFCRVHDDEVRQFVEANLPDESRPLHGLPPKPDEFSISELSELLFDSGLSNASVNLTIEAISKIRRMLSWYRRAGYPKEHETVAHMVIPLLQGLGWSEQQQAVEWNNIDVALFGTASHPQEVRKNENCQMIIEVKRVGDGLWWAEKQAKQYREQYALQKSCKRIVVTDGIRYNVFSQRSGAFESRYINLDHDKLFKQSIDGTNSVEALLWMRPY